MYHFDQVGSIAGVHQLWLQLVDCCLRPRCSLQGRQRLGRRGRIVPRTFREGLVQNAKCTRRATRHRHRLAGKRAALDVDACCWCGRRCTTLQRCTLQKAGDNLRQLGQVVLQLDVLFDTNNKLNIAVNEVVTWSSCLELQPASTAIPSSNKA